MQDILVTNNNLVPQKLTALVTYDLLQGSYKDVLVKVRDYIHKGHRLLSHPLSGSVKPNENPFKSVLISGKAGSNTDTDSIRIIEGAIATADKFPLKYTNIPDRIMQDFATVDLTLISSAFCNKL